LNYIAIKPTEMSDFKELYSVIVSHCTEQRSFELLDHLDLIAMDAAIPKDDLDASLSSLQDYGLINYSMKDDYVHLRSAGVRPDVFRGD